METIAQTIPLSAGDERARPGSNESNVVDFAAVRACLQKLPQKHREVVQACAVGLTPAEVAAQTGLNPASVRTYASSARRQLRVAMAAL